MKYTFTSQIQHWAILAICFLSLSTMVAQSRDMLMNQGDQAYKSEEFLTAQSYYTESDLKKPSIEATYNQANALFMQEKQEEAVRLWERVTDSEDLNLQAAAYHNLGNAHLQNQKVDKAIEAYKKSLRIKPDDPGTRRNLALAQLMKEQDPQPQEQQQSDENQESQDSEEQENSEDQQESEENQDQQENNEQQESEEEEEGSESESGEPSEEEQLEEMTKQELDRLLEVLEEEDKKVQQKAAIGKTTGKKTEKQW